MESDLGTGSLSTTQFGREPGELVDHFLLLDSSRGISDSNALQRIALWLTKVHSARHG
jgi:hypothetical protein